ncbi:hypothetical protein MiSe_90730 [Microseira wollei NIES-4236]|uniref:Uncharacterized protein n=1 Tax=Microseira wollei NIES-4236 TaxID=2530354 RepID=A0AAV3XUI2_9CYAN|nr:hypothetical protein MiSe_90730 [Microseira wollei NIES-4236]
MPIILRIAIVWRPRINSPGNVMTGMLYAIASRVELHPDQPRLSRNTSAIAVAAANILESNRGKKMQWS